LISVTNKDTLPIVLIIPNKRLIVKGINDSVYLSASSPISFLTLSDNEDKGNKISSNTLFFCNYSAIVIGGIKGFP